MIPSFLALLNFLYNRGWVYRKDVTPLGNVDMDRHKLEQVKKGKKVKRIAEVRKGYEYACKLLKIDPNRALTPLKKATASLSVPGAGESQESRSASSQASGIASAARGQTIVTGKIRSRAGSGSVSEVVEAELSPSLSPEGTFNHGDPVVVAICGSGSVSEISSTSSSSPMVVDGKGDT